MLGNDAERQIPTTLATTADEDLDIYMRAYKATQQGFDTRKDNLAEVIARVRSAEIVQYSFGKGHAPSTSDRFHRLSRV